MDQELLKLVQNAEKGIGNTIELSNLISHLYTFDDEGLYHVISLAISDYEGYTYKYNLQDIATTCILRWHEDGINAFVDRLKETKSYVRIAHALRFLGHLSSNNVQYIFGYNSELGCIKSLDLKDPKYRDDKFVDCCKEALLKAAQIQIDSNHDMLPDSMYLSLSFVENEEIQNHIFSSLIARWAKFNSKGLKKYNELINSQVAEQTVHLFLKNNPFILEPFHSQIWSKPRFGENLVPDFLIKSMDNSYTIIEIEKPQMSIFTKACELTAEVTHAKRQVIDFRNWINNNSLYARQKYENIYDPFCLVVIGNERTLSDRQKERLKQENESTGGKIKIVGFDWFYNRANSVINNLIKFGFNSISIE